MRDEFAFRLVTKERIARGFGLLFRELGRFGRTLAWTLKKRFRPMRREYRKRFGMKTREWLKYLHSVVAVRTRVVRYEDD